MAVDDDNSISSVLRLLLRDPQLSRRQAILRIAGEDSLRRIEMKMKQAADDGTLPAMYRRVIADLHAERYPMSLDKGGGFTRFSCRTPCVGAAGYLSVTLGDDGFVRAISHHYSKSLDVVHLAENRLPGDGLVDSHLSYKLGGKSSAAYETLCDLGLAWPVSNGVIDRSAAQPPFITTTATALAKAWKSVPDAVSDLDGQDTLDLALMHEEARADRCGYSIVAGGWGEDMKNVVTLLEAASESGYFLDNLIRVRKNPALAKIASKLGPFAKLLTDAFYRGVEFAALDPETFLAGAVSRKDWLVRVGDKFRSATPADASWLLNLYGDTPLSPVEIDEIERLFLQCSDIKEIAPSDVDSKIAIVRLFAAGCDSPHARSYSKYGEDVHGISGILLRAARNGMSSADLLASLLRIAAEHQVSLSEVVAHAWQGPQRMAVSLMAGVVLPLLSDPDSLNSRLRRAELATRIFSGKHDDPILSIIHGGQSPDAMAEASLKWMEANYPGQVPVDSGMSYRRLDFMCWEIPDDAEASSVVYERLRPYLGGAERFEDFAARLKDLVGAETSADSDASSPSFLRFMMEDWGFMAATGALCVIFLLGILLISPRETYRPSYVTPVSIDRHTNVEPLVIPRTPVASPYVVVKPPVGLAPLVGYPKQPQNP